LFPSWFGSFFLVKLNVQVKKKQTQQQQQKQMSLLTVAMLKQIPKAELHYHLDGSLRVETILALAKEDNVTLPSKDILSLTKLVRVGAECRSLVEFLEAYRITLSVMQTRRYYFLCNFHFVNISLN
jgi:adenosine deaminase